MISRRLLLQSATLTLAAPTLPTFAYLQWHEEAFPLAAKDIEALTHHPFITGLIEGTLPQESFLWYLCQNLNYLAGYEKSLMKLAPRLTDKNDRKQVLAWAKETSATYRWTSEVIKSSARHRDTDRYRAVRPTTRRYIEWEAENAAKAPVSVAWATLLPCFWVYGEVGRFVSANKKPDSPYAAWLDGYGDPAYEKTVDAAAALADRLAAQDAKNRRRATDAFLSSVKFEAALWDAAVKLEA